ncbi:MAG: signal peptide peptidase SppA [Ideonella sp.]
MSEEKPGVIRRFFRWIWRFIDGSRRVVLNLIFLGIVALVVFGLVKSMPPTLGEKTALLLNLDGSIGEQATGSLRATALDQVRGEAAQKIQLRDVVAVLDAAATDPKISSVVLMLDELQPSGFATLREVAAAIDRFRSSGKQVVAWGSNYDQRQYYLATHADEVYLHPYGGVLVTGFGSLRNYYKDAMDKVGIKANLIRVGTYKSFAEPYIGNGPSPAAIEADTALYGSLWNTYTDDVEARRKLAPGTIAKLIDEAPERLAAAGGDIARFALEQKLVDGLKTRDQLRALMISRGALDDEEKTFRQVSFGDYLGRIKTPSTGDAIGVVVAEGEIVDGTASSGTVGGLSTSALIRKARENKDIRAVILRVNSPGGSVFGSELVRHELELTRAAGKPVVVSMGDVAASGGYWISTASDEIIADPATITGSIGVFALLPQADQALDKVGVHVAGVSTTWLHNAGDPRLPMDPRFAQLLQTNIDHIYAEFTGKVAAARKTTPTKIDAIGQGRVWTGIQAKERGLVDRLGLFGDAVKSAAARAKLGDKPRLVYIERDPGAVARLVAMFNAEVTAAVGHEFDVRIGAFGMPPMLLRNTQRDLGWLAGVAERKKPFEAVVHCMCASP